MQKKGYYGHRAVTSPGSRMVPFTPSRVMSLELMGYISLVEVALPENVIEGDPFTCMDCIVSER